MTTRLMRVCSPLLPYHIIAGNLEHFAGKGFHTRPPPPRSPALTASSRRPVSMRRRPASGAETELPSSPSPDAKPLRRLSARCQSSALGATSGSSGRPAAGRYAYPGEKPDPEPADLCQMAPRGQEVSSSALVRYSAVNAAKRCASTGSSGPLRSVPA